jgi:hypothetical protein
MTPYFYDASAGRGAVDLYTYFLNNQWVLEGTDGVHPNVEGREFFDKIWRDTAFHFAYHGAMPAALVPQTFKTPAQDASSLVVSAEASRETADINTAQAKLTELNSWPEFSSEQSSLQTRLNNVIPTSALFYLVDFGRPESNYTTTPNWNNLSTITASSSINLITNAGATSSLSLKISTAFTGITTTGLDFTDLPFTADRDGFLVRSYISPDSVLTLSGLNLLKKYTFILYSGTSLASPDNITDFTINSVKKSMVSSNNTSSLVQFDNIIPNAQGEIIITVGTDTNYGIINAISIRETENPPSCIDGILNQDETLIDVGGVCGTAITLTYAAGAHGSLTGTLSQTINSGANGTAVTAVPAANYHFVNWSDGSTENPITHTGVTTNINLTANFAINQNTLTYVAGGNGSITGNLYQSVDYNTNGSAVTAVPSNGYHFENWSDGSTQNPRTDSSVVANVSVTANFVMNTPTCSDGIKNQNETGIDTGGLCSIRTYLIDFGSASSTQTTGNWNNMTNPLTPSSMTDIIDNTGATSSIDLAITNRFTTFGALGVNTTTGIYPQNVVLDYFYVQNGSTSTIKFSSLGSNKTYNFKFFASRAGTGTRNSEFIINGTSVVLSAMNNSNNVVSINGVSPDINGEISVTIRPEGSATYAYLNAVEVTENPVIVNRTLIYSAGANGTLTGSSTQIVNNGADATEVTALANTNYHFTSWSDGVLTASRTDTSVTGDKTVSANFTINNYSLTYSAGVNGSLTGSSTQVINHGADGTEVTALANTNYHFVRWSDNVMTATRKETNVIAGKNLTAIFAINTYTLAYSAGSNGTITGTSTQVINHGLDGTEVTALANTNYHFTSWSDGILTAGRTDTSVTGDKTVSANFAINNYTLTYSAGANGSLTGSSTQVVNHGSDGTEVMAVANTNYHFVRWSDNVMTATRTDLNIISNKSVTANFELNILPVITLIGAKHIILYQGQTYVEPGATARDELDGVLSGVIQSSNVNTSQVGSYNVRYNIENSSHYAATEVVRTVEVKSLAMAKSKISDSQATNIYIPSTVSSPTLDLTSLTATSSATSTVVALPADINITKTTSIGDVSVNIPSGINLTLSTSTWNGIINLAQINNNPTITASAGKTASVFSAFEIGLTDTSITFDKAVKITFPGAKNKLVGWSRSGLFNKITTECLENSQSWANSVSNLAIGADCRINSGDDLVIWTKHFTSYITYSEENTANETPTSTNQTSNSGVVIVMPNSLLPGSNLDFTINNSSKVTNSKTISINFNANPKTVSGYAISTDGNFSNSSIYKYVTSTTINLPNGPGKYVVYVKYFSYSGHSSPTLSHSIEYQTNIIPIKTKDSSTSNLDKKIINKYYFSKNLKIGDTNADVKELQKFLNSNGYIISKLGLGSKGKETNYFGAATKNALIKFQKNKLIKPASGLFGPVTRKVLNAS